MITTPEREIATSRILKLINGEDVVMDGQALDNIEVLAPGLEVRAIANPNRIGTKDVFLCWIGSYEKHLHAGQTSYTGGDSREHVRPR